MSRDYYRGAGKNLVNIAAPLQFQRSALQSASLNEAPGTSNPPTAARCRHSQRPRSLPMKLRSGAPSGRITRQQRGTANRSDDLRREGTVPIHTRSVDFFPATGGAKLRVAGYTGFTLPSTGTAHPKVLPRNRPETKAAHRGCRCACGHAGSPDAASSATQRSCIGNS